MTEQPRTVAAERDLSRVHQWLDTAVAHAVNEAAQALNAIRYWCLQTEKTIADHGAEEGAANPCEYCDALALAVRQVRALLPAVPETSNRRAETGEEVTSDARDASDARRPGLVSPGGSETGGGHNP